jgi:hypothetical protein
MVRHLSIIRIMKNSIKLFFLIAALTSFSVVFAQDSKEISVQKMVESKNFIFKAQTVLPQRGGMRQLTSDYDLRLLGDSVVSFLPFFGRAYTAPIGSSEGGIKFTSTDFNYDIKKKKKGWDITILPKDTREVRQLFLSVSSNGYARLQVLSNNREGIAYNGYVTEIKQ